MSRCRVLVLVFASILPCLVQAAAGQDEEAPVIAPIKRYALVIGIEKYKPLDPVVNAENDAKEVGRALAQVGFTVRPILGEDTDTRYKILKAVDDLVLASGGSEEPATIVVYFAGHGFQWTGSQIPPTDFIVPRTARKPRLLKGTDTVDNSPLVEDSVELTDLIAHLGGSRRAGVTILLLDACRGDVFALDGKPTRKIYGFVKPSSENVVLSFSTSFNYLAASISRDTPSHSPYAAALQEMIPIPSIPLHPVVLANVREKVKTQSPFRDQVPDELNVSRAGFFYFDPRESEAAKENEYWRKAVARGDPDCIRTFLALFPDGRLAQHALKKLESARPAERGCTLF